MKIISGSTAAKGTLRPSMISGDRRAWTRGKHPAVTPIGTPTISASAKPMLTRRNVTSTLRVRAKSFHSSGNLPNVSAGLGNVSGPTIRDSYAPRVRNHHPAKQTRTQATPNPMACNLDTGLRNVSQLCDSLFRKVEFMPRGSKTAEQLVPKRELGNEGIKNRQPISLLLRRVNLDLDAAVLGVVERVG